ncbi:thioesterase [Acrocarpospora pleiomorpha]|uniref:Acyl-coenzyme A thioesterase THEM4 n=1 Tax=Acrocarpospora pleiomorpha TaxID=90975 RepID=A0A5M3XMH1_9ACTN|nr:hotdog domain-containing protein [Acrocarpospora pleiomorpha]GES19368.1 thioesterase [Acrocarpospora pleiomorpha]
MTSEPFLFDPWVTSLPQRPGGDAYARLLAEFRRLHDLVAATSLDEPGLREVTERLRAASAALEIEGGRPGPPHAGNRYDLPGRGHPLLVPLVIDEWTAERITGSVVFTAAHLGGNGAAHGGAIPLLFDEVLGRLANTNRHERARTAYLHVNYRSITPLHTPLRVVATVMRQEGRKRYLAVRLCQDAQVLADGEGLFVTLRPGQP